MFNFFEKNKKTKKDFNYDSGLQIFKRVLIEAFLPNAFYFGIAIVLMSICASAIAYRAYLVKPAIDQVFLDKNTTALIIIPLQVIGIAIAISAMTFIEMYLMQRTTTRINMKYQKSLFEKIVKFDIDYFQNKSSYKILDHFADIGGLMSALNLILTGVIKQLLTIIGLVGLMFYQSPALSCVAFIAFPVAIYPIYRIGRSLKSMATKGRELSGSLAAGMGESLGLIKLVKSNATEDYEVSKLEYNIKTVYKMSMKMIRKSLATSPMMEMAGSIGFAGVIWYGGGLVIKGEMTTGAFFTFMTALFSVYKPAKSFAGLNIQIQTALISAKRLFRVLDREPEIKDKENSVELKDVIGDVEFKNVSFRYPLHDKNEPLVPDVIEHKLCDKIALNNINLSIKHGNSIALVGHSGSGKSTISYMLLRFYDPTEGKILIDGKDIKNLKIKSLRDNISVVSQEVLIFNDTVKANVKYGAFNATDEQVIEACKLANAEDFINELPDGYDTILGPNGCLLSGGQRQRISIARAILKNTPILLLDEATSALDPISEKLIQSALNRLMKNRTTIIIAHRLSTIQNCDRIFVLQEGELKEQGNHEELLAQNGIYANMYTKQFEKAI
ncbi:MAG TPA: ABC transporter ATP-binding protein [Rickettsiales bacterium]|nr:ABC transporter ATP-binding protein [Rickettsiales bacterium]